jgi:hypothetical protein
VGRRGRGRGREEGEAMKPSTSQFGTSPPEYPLKNTRDLPSPETETKHKLLTRKRKMEQIIIYDFIIRIH